jgi:hypothetical protein
MAVSTIVYYRFAIDRVKEASDTMQDGGYHSLPSGPTDEEALLADADE